LKEKTKDKVKTSLSLKIFECNTINNRYSTYIQ